MGPIKAIASCYRKILTISGRARRAEYWWFFLYLTLVGAGLQLALALEIAKDGDVVATLMNEDMLRAWMLGNTDVLCVVGYVTAGYLVLGWLPSFTVTIRRLHDTNRSGWFIFMPFMAYLATLGGALFLTVATAGQGAILALLALTIVPLAASLWFFIVLCLPGTHGTNRFGPDPVPNRRRKAPAHPAFAPQLPAEERAQMAAHRQSEIHEYYRQRVLPSIQKV